MIFPSQRRIATKCFSTAKLVYVGFLVGWLGRRCRTFDDVLIIADAYHRVFAAFGRALGNLCDPVFITPAIQLGLSGFFAYFFAMLFLFSTLPAWVSGEPPDGDNKADSE